MRSHRVLLPLAAVLSTACTDRVPSPTAVPTATQAQNAKGPTGGDTPVLSELLGGGGGPNLSIQSDQQGGYTTSGGVSSILQSSFGDWVLDLTAKKATRKVNVELTDPLPDNPAPAPFTSSLVKARFIAKASLLTSGGFAGMTGLGTTIMSPLSIAEFSSGGKTYAIRMNRDNHPETDWAQVTCIGVAANSACTKWRVTPTGNYGGVTKNVGYLEQVSPSVAFVGLYYFTFDITITK